MHIIASKSFWNQNTKPVKSNLEKKKKVFEKLFFFQRNSSYHHAASIGKVRYVKWASELTCLIGRHWNKSLAPRLRRMQVYSANAVYIKQRSNTSSKVTSWASWAPLQFLHSTIQFKRFSENCHKYQQECGVCKF